ncbi:MAG: type IX secretion system sortase PorU, partial [Acidobacteriota bacterium]
GNQFFDYDTSSHRVVRYFHPYSNSNYYWLTFSQGQSKKMQAAQSLTQNPDFVQTTTKAFASWEEDKYKLMNSGRYYVGDDFSETNNSRTYLTNLNGIVSGSSITYKFNFVNRSEYSAVISLYENSASVLSAYISGVGVGLLDDPQANYAISQAYNATYRANLPDERSMLKFTYKPNPGSQSTGYLNYFEIYYDKQLKAYNDALMFYSMDTTGVDEFRLNGFGRSDIQVFDVTDYANLRLVSGANISGGDCSFRSQVQKGRLSKYMAVTPAAYLTPGRFTEMGNSNVHATPEAKFIIITNKAFQDEANRLKTFKESQAKFKISTSVVDVDQIFNEFSNGMKDVSAIRNFIRYAYDNWSVKPEYVLLMGDGNYDYKDVEKYGQNFVIPYESYESYNYINSYVSDDYYVTVSGNDDILDLAIGRINAVTAADAKASVDKIIRYETQSDLGLWRNLVTMVADDAYTSDGPENAEHAIQSETVSNYYIPPTFDQNKIYEEFYPTVATGTGRRKPAVNQAIIKAINDGTLILNWIGHGNPEVWAHEYVFEKNVSIPQLVNDKLFFLVAATCDFGRYDEPGTQSSTELMILKPDGGSIGSFTAARTVYSGDNFNLAKEFYSNLFRTDSTGYLQPVGKSYYATKMVRNDINDLKFHLFGDPTIRLLAPTKAAGIDSVDHRASSANIQVKALSKTSIEGSVKRPDGSIDNSFNGEGIVSVYDSQKLVKMKEYANSPATFQGGLLFRGMVSVANGKFSTDFQVPKDISYENKNGKVVAYLYNGNNDNVVGYTSNIIVGGTDSTAVNDGKGPEISITFDDAKNTSSYLVSPAFTMDVKLKDASGLNTTGTGIGHKITGILNENEASPIDLSGYFVGDLNAGGKSGTIKYKFNGLESGDYKVQVRAWDIFNNSSESEEHFTVVGGSDLVVRDVLNYPNPFSTSTTFTFQRNTSTPVDVKIRVYTVAGRMIKEIENMAVTDKFVRIDWDGRDNDGNLLANGVYLYKVTIKGAEEASKQEVLGKLAVMR